MNTFVPFANAYFRRDVASFSGSVAKDRPKRRGKDHKRANHRRDPATMSQDSRTTGVSGSRSAVKERCLESQNHSRHLPLSERFAAAPVREETSPPVVSSHTGVVSNGEPSSGFKKSPSLPREQEFLSDVELGEKSQDLDSSETQQLISPLDLAQLSLDDKIEPTQFPDSGKFAQRRCQESIHSQLTRIVDRKEQRDWSSDEATSAFKRVSRGVMRRVNPLVSTNRVRSALSLESFETIANGSLGDMPTQIYASPSRTHTMENYPRNSPFGRHDNFRWMASGTNLDVNESLLLERVRSAGKTFVRKFDANSSSCGVPRVVEQTKDQRKMKKSLSARLEDLSSDLGLAVKKGQPEAFVSQCSWTRKQPEVRHLRDSTAHEQPEVLDSQGSSSGKQPEVFDSQSSNHGIVDLDHSYSGRKVPKDTGSEKPRGRKRGWIGPDHNFTRKIRKIDHLESTGPKSRLTGKVCSSEDKENSTNVPYCPKLKNKNEILGEHSLLDDIFPPLSVVASPLSTIVSTKQTQSSRSIVKDVFEDSRTATGNVRASKFTGEPEVDSKCPQILGLANTPKHRNVLLSDSSLDNFIPWCADVPFLLPVDLLANHCCEYDQAFPITPTFRGHEFRSCEKTSLTKIRRVSSSEMTKKVEKILQFLDKDCVDF